MLDKNTEEKRIEKQFGDELRWSVKKIEYQINKPDSMGRFRALVEYKRLGNCCGCLRSGVKDKTIAALCCGSGMEAEFFSKRGAKVVGVDIGKGFLVAAQIRKKRHNFDVDLILADAEFLPLKDSSFDIVLFYDGLHHLPNPYKGVSEAWRVTKEAIVLSEPMKIPLITRILGVFGFQYEYTGRRMLTFSEAEIKEMLTKVGFQSIKITRVFSYVPGFLMHRSLTHRSKYVPKYLIKLEASGLLYLIFKLWLNIAFSNNVGRFGNAGNIVGYKENRTEEKLQV